MDIVDDIKLIGENDKLFEGNAYPSPFAFDDRVAGVFDDMVSRSVPLYRDVIRATCFWTWRHLTKASTILDLGCSTGTTLTCVAHVLRKKNQNAKLIGIDNSQPMLDLAKTKLASYSEHDVQLTCADLLDYTPPKLSVGIINYTLQFLPVHQRPHLIKRLFHATESGGALIMSEKVRSTCPAIEEGTTTYYEAFKRSQGYSDHEIARKKEALDRVLIPLSCEQLTDMLHSAGYERVETIMRWHNFVTILATKA